MRKESHITAKRDIPDLKKSGTFLRRMDTQCRLLSYEGITIKECLP